MLWAAIGGLRLSAYNCSGPPCAAETDLDMNRPDQQATPIPLATSPAKRGYIVALRCSSVVFRYLGILRLLERFKGNLAARYLRSLFAIYDPVDLMRLDLLSLA